MDTEKESSEEMRKYLYRYLLMGDTSGKSKLELGEPPTYMQSRSMG